MRQTYCPRCKVNFDTGMTGWCYKCGDTPQEEEVSDMDMEPKQTWKARVTLIGETYRRMEISSDRVCELLEMLLDTLPESEVREVYIYRDQEAREEAGK